MNKLIITFSFSLIFSILLVSSVFASHFITGIANDALDGTSSNGYTVILYNSTIGKSDNLTDIIGPTGNSGADNIYLIDCELLDTSCTIGDVLTIEIISNGSKYISVEQVNVLVTSAGFDISPNITLNSPPNVILSSPINNFNSTSPLDFTCQIEDLDGNLINSTLFGNWSTDWHQNLTNSISGFSNSSIFNVDIEDGFFKWGCRAYDSSGIFSFSNQNYSITIDSTPPEITQISSNTSQICRNEYVRINCTTTDETTGLDTILINSLAPNGSYINHSTQFLVGNTYYSDISLTSIGNWNFSCIATDFLNNTNITSGLSVLTNSEVAEIKVSSEDISFIYDELIENLPITINTTIHNQGCQDVVDSTIQFLENNITQIGSNINVSINAFSNFTINISWPPSPGPRNIFVKSDFYNDFSELNETNNNANKTIFVSAWQFFYGNISLDLILSSSDNSNLSIWFNTSNPQGNIYITDHDSIVDFSSLQPLGRNISGSVSNQDFSELDSSLSMESFNDSVSLVFTDNQIPFSTYNLTIMKNTVYGIPYINSSNSTFFTTAILWDTSDDTNGEYDLVDLEDVVFLARVNSNSAGAFGIYDYEMRIPARLRNYLGPNTEIVSIYHELT